MDDETALEPFETIAMDGPTSKLDALFEAAPILVCQRRFRLLQTVVLLMQSFGPRESR